MTPTERAERAWCEYQPNIGRPQLRARMVDAISEEIAAAISEAVRPMAPPELVALRVEMEERWGKSHLALDTFDTLLSHIAYLDALLRDCQQDSTAYARGVQDGLERGAAECEQLRNALVTAMLPYEALRLDEQSRRWIAPEVWAEILAATRRARTLLAMEATT